MANDALTHSDDVDSEPLPPDVDFWSLGNLLYLGYKPKDLASRIEKHGLQCWDRFGRLTTVTPGSKKADDARFVNEAIEALAAEYSASLDHEVAPPSIYEDGTGPFARYGWSDASWKLVSKGVSVPRSRAIEIGKQRRATSDLAIIAALLDFIKGRFPGVLPHPQFKSLDELTSIISEKFEARYGCSDVSWKFVSQGVDVPRPQVVEIGEKSQEINNLANIAGLLDFIKGRFPGVRQHPQYGSQGVLASIISEKFEYRGTKKRTLEKRFAAANRTFKVP